MTANILDFFGRFHPVLVHLPIGILLIGIILQLLSIRKKYAFLKPAAPFVLFIGAVTAAMSCLSGYLLSLNGSYENSLVNWHMWMGIIVTLTAFLLYGLLQKNSINRFGSYLAIVLIVLITFTGHLGGSLTHGSDYLTAAFNPEDDPVAKQKIIIDVQQALAYDDVIQPILQNKCYQCHGAKRQKGNLRLDQSEFIMKGGKKGLAIQPGKADESEVIKRLLLPEEDEHHMAPKNKPQLNEQQIALVQWWINEGADFHKKVQDIQQPEKIKPVLLALQSNQQQKKLPPAIPETAIEKADDRFVQQLKDIGVIIIPVAQNSNYLLANFVNAKQLGSQELSAIKALKKQLVWLKLGNTVITDEGLQTIGECKNLTQLQLNHTAITNKGLKALKELQNLQTLNLVGTAITADGLTELQELKELRTVYLYQTQVPQKDWNTLQQKFPNTLLDSGGYRVTNLLSDTSLVH